MKPLFIHTSQGIVNRNQIIKINFTKAGIAVTLANDEMFLLEEEEAYLFMACCSPSIGIGRSTNYPENFRNPSEYLQDKASEVTSACLQKLTSQQ